MAFIPVTDGAQAFIEYYAGDISWTNSLWFTRSSYTQTELEQLAEDIWDWAASDIMPYLSNVCALGKVTVYDMRSEYAPVDTYVTTPVVGSIADPLAPINVAAVVTFRTGGRGRVARGRNYVGGMAETDVDGTSINDAAIQTGLQTAYQNLMTDAAGWGWEWDVVSKVENGTPRASGLAQEITDAEIRNSVVGTQRRRVPRT